MAAVTGGQLVGVTAAHAATTTITSAGPLTEIGISTDLNCSVRHVDDADPEFYGGTACGTLAVVDGVLYGPATIPAGGGASPRTTWTETSQSPVQGSGTAADPYRVVTVVTAGTSGVTLTQTDSYVVGQESYRTDIATSVSPDRTTPVDVRLYRAGDCYLQNSDTGFGAVDAATGAVACVNAVDGAPGSRIEQWVPLTSGSRYYEASYSEVWAVIGAQAAFPNSCECDQLQDNGAGLSWDFTVAPGGRTTQSHLTNFSPLGTEPLVASKTADSASVAAGGANGYTITIRNPGATSVELTSFTDQLPAGFAYTPGSTTGATTADPSISGQTLTWPVSVSLAPEQSSALHFGVTVTTTPGTYYNEAGGTAATVAVVGTGPTAPVTVTAAEQPHATSTTNTSGSTVQYSDVLTLSGVLVDTSTDPDAPLVGKTLVLSYGGNTGSATTDSAGAASRTSQVLAAPGSITTTLASFEGDSDHLASQQSAPLAITREDCTLQYTGDLFTPIGSASRLAAVLGEPDSSLGDLSLKSVSFTVVPSDGSAPVTVADATDATGLAETTTTLPAGVYEVTPSFAGDDFYAPCTGAAVLLAVDGTDSRVTGGGFVVDGGRTSFGMVAASDGTGDRGQLQVRMPGRHRFHGSTVESLTVNGSTATWQGTGRYDGVDGYRYQVSVTDNRNGGSRRTSAADTVAIRITDPQGQLVFDTSGALKGGNITVH